MDTMTVAQLQDAIDSAVAATESDAIHVAEAAVDHYRALTHIQRRVAYYCFANQMLVEKTEP